MTAMTTLPLRRDGWTVDDLELLPDDPPFRYELVDGTLVVSLVKPHQYATAGIPHFWRYEPTTQVLITHELAGGVYRETARFDDEVVVDVPVPLRFRLADLLP